MSETTGKARTMAWPTLALLLIVIVCPGPIYADGGFHPSTLPLTHRDPTFRDPTRPPAQLSQVPKTQPHTVSFQLDSILVGTVRQVAVINGHRVVVGDKIGNARVTRIHPDHVQLLTSDKTIRLTKFDIPAIRQNSK